MFRSLLLLLITVSAQTLVLLGDQYKSDDYSEFFKSLQDRGHNLVFETKIKAVKVVEYEEKLYENVLIMSPLASCFLLLTS